MIGGEHRPVVLVSGAAGFIGSHVCVALANRGHRVVALDNLEAMPGSTACEAYAEQEKRANLEWVLSGDRGDRGVRFVRADITDADGVDRLFESSEKEGRPIERVVHLAAKAGVTPSLRAPVEYARTNVLGTSIMLDAARRHGVRAFVLASSSSVYGERSDDGRAFREDDRCDSPRSPYAATKLACEHLGRAAAEHGSMGVACLRFFTVFGPRQRPDLAIARFMRLLASGHEIPQRGDGSSSRDYTYIDDIVSGVLSAADRVRGFRVWNLGGNRPVRLTDLIATIGRITGIEPRVRREPSAAGDVSRTFADLARSRDELGYEPRVGLEEGLRRQWGWFSDALKKPLGASVRAG